MFSSSKSGWHPYVALLITAFFLYALVGVSFSKRVSGNIEPHRYEGLSNILSPETIDALYQDTRLNHAIISLTEAVVETTKDIGKTFKSEGLKDFAKNLTHQLATMRNTNKKLKRKRGLLDMFTGGLEGGLGLGEADGNSTGGLGSLLQQGLSGIGDSIFGGLATPALFLGIGVGMGTGTGLNLTDMAQSQALAMRIAASYNVTPEGINVVAQNLGSGLSAQLIPTLGNLADGTQIGMAAFALAQGIGQGTASGLNLTMQTFQPTNDTSIIGIAGNFGLGVSSPIAGSIDVQKLVASAGTDSQIMQRLPQIAAAAGKGLGEGASNGFGLAKPIATPQRRQVPSGQNQTDIPEAVEEFTRALSQSFLQSSDLNKAVDMIAPGASNGLNFNVIDVILPIASGAGQGIGEGAAIGLGFKADVGLTTMSGNFSSTKKTEMIAAEFSKSLVAGFLANGTAQIALANLSSGAGSLSMNIQATKVTEGLARGLVEGSVNAISTVGGIENLLSGNFSLEAAMNIPAMITSNFNDSVNGSAVAFGRGLAGEGTLLVANLITNMTKTRVQKRALSAGEEIQVDPYRLLNSRQEPRTGTPPLAVNSTMLSGFAQAGSDAITCQGFGGLVAIGLGLMNSGTIKIDTKNPVPLDSQTLAVLPKDPVTILSEGNKFEFQIQSTEIKINGMQIIPFAVLTSLHVALTTFAFFYALPAYLALGAIWRLSVLIGYPFNLASNQKWRFWILVLFVFSSIIGIIFGIAGMGGAAHFSSGHGILGLVTFILIIPTVIVSVLRLRSTAPLPSPTVYVGIKGVVAGFKGESRIYVISAFFHNFLLQFGMISWIQGFSLLRSISLCIVDAVLTAPIVVGLVSFLLFLQIGATSLVGLRIWFEQRMAKKEKLMAEGGVVELGPAEKIVLQRSDTMKTFGFNERDASPERSESRMRNTTELKGREDSKIGWPSKVRKFGEEDTIPARLKLPSDSKSSVDSSGAGANRQTTEGRNVQYNEKLGGYETERDSEYTASDPGHFGRDEQQSGPYRRSSGEVEPRAYDKYGQPYPVYDRYGQPYEPQDRELQQDYQSFSRPRTRDGEFTRPSGEEITVQYSNMMSTSTSREQGGLR